MLKLTQLLTLATISVTASAVAWAGPTLTKVDFPGAISTTLNGGPNPEGTFIGTYSLDGIIFHGFTLEKGIYTTIDPPGSVSTTPNWISPEGTIVGGFTDTGGVNHGFILKSGTYTTVDYPGAFTTTLDGINPSGEMVGLYCTSAGNCTGGLDHSFILSKAGVLTSFDPPGAVGSLAASVNPSGTIVGTYGTGVGGVNALTLGYVLHHGMFTTIAYPLATSTFVGGNNAAGALVGAKPILRASFTLSC